MTTSHGPSVPLATINARAAAHAYTVDAVDWARGVDPALPWFPHAQMPLAATPTFATLPDDARLQANQWYACAVAEQFIFLEEEFLAKAVHALLARDDVRHDSELSEALTVFLDEEMKHSAMFRRLLQASDPVRYADTHRSFYTPGWLGPRALDLLTRTPALFVAWPWLGLVLEEKTITYHRAYAAAHAAGEALDPLHRQVHVLHFQDEARHVQIEEHLVARLYGAAPAAVRAVNRRLFFSILRKYTAPRPRSVSANIARAVVARWPALAPRLPTWLDELASLKDDLAWQDRAYGRDALPRTFAALRRHDEMRGIAAVSPSYAAAFAAKGAPGAS